ncbi:Transposon Ty3-G Gag-Pol polyprotein [Gossypium australe]|uniref:Transposon Ty3-G Gag-Pol polyprotein n=1 Tax=Gossypium australe TaxID=47621 RepID=A0A5B6X0B9_9ROSI|nr:Transposon Ty3-G Gag-Pol polyprotein [Gossypium australe]
MIYAEANGTLNNKTPEATQEVKPAKAVGVFDIDVVSMLASQVEGFDKKIDGLSLAEQMNPIMQSDVTGVGMINSKYSPFKSNIEYEQVSFLGNNFRPRNDPYNNNHNPGWRNHLNFSFGGKGNQRSQPPTGF